MELLIAIAVMLVLVIGWPICGGLLIALAEAMRIRPIHEMHYVEKVVGWPIYLALLIPTVVLNLIYSSEKTDKDT